MAITLCRRSGVAFCVFKFQLRFDAAHVLDFGQRRQVVEAGEVKIVEENSGGAEQGWLAGHVTVANYPDLFALLQRPDDVGPHRYATYFFDVAPGDGLAVSDQRQRFQQGP